VGDRLEAPSVPTVSGINSCLEVAARIGVDRVEPIVPIGRREVGAGFTVQPHIYKTRHGPGQVAVIVDSAHDAVADCVPVASPSGIASMALVLL